MKKLFSSFANAFAGIGYCCRSEKNFKIHLIAIPIVVFFGFYCAISPLQWMIIVLCIGAVLSMEMINTAIEKICDYIQPEKHHAIKVIKDVAAGATLIVACMAVVCAALIFIPAFKFLS